MNYDQYGQAWTTPNELFDLLYQNPELDLSRFLVKFGGEKTGQDVLQYNHAVKDTYSDFPVLNTRREVSQSVEEFDREQQGQWHMPDQYKQLDIAQWVLDQCKTQQELQRVGQELLLYQEREAFDLLRYLKYFVDTMRAQGVVWGLGRGSSVASYVLYLIGVHRINSLYYDLDIKEFLK
jgi:DNA polymerase III alpha subunit